jgi:hypothetical protein
LGVNNIPGIEEVNLFRDNGTVVHFKNPKVERGVCVQREEEEEEEEEEIVGASRARMK